MKRIERIALKIKADKETMKRINSVSYYSGDDFIHDADMYISAIKQGRMLCVIHSVSQSGMSRTMSFHSCEKHTHTKGVNFSYRQYVCLFLSLGYTKARNWNTAFSIGGCGMDMVFNTNYTIIHRLYNLGFMTKEECNHLCQQTPTYF